MNILRRMSLHRLLLLCAVVVGVGVSATAIASAVDAGPTPPAKPLAQAVHDALAAPTVQGVSASVKLTDRLLEGANLASGSGQGGELTSNPLITGASGRLWISGGRARLELQSEKGDTQVVYDGSTVTMYDAATNTLYRYKLPAREKTSETAPAQHEAPSVAKIEEAIQHLSNHADVSEAQPSDVAGQAAYTVRVSPKEKGSLIGGAELAFDAANGVPLRAALYSSTSSAPVIELAAQEISYGPVDASVFQISPPANATVHEIASSDGTQKPSSGTQGEKPEVTTQGNGLTTIAVAKAKAHSGEGASLENLPQVNVGGTSASELRTELGTILSFERAGVRYIVAGAVEPAAVEAVARGL